MSGITPGVVTRLSDRVRRITAPNPGPMTGPGTNTYLIGTRQIAVVDPGPLSESHLDAILLAGEGRIRWILCTHTHPDHSPGAGPLYAATGADVWGYPAPRHGHQDHNFAPNRVLRGGERLETEEFTLRALHTPGHASNHICYLLEEERMLFTGDHVMQGSTVVIGPPDGNMSAYMRSLHALLEEDLASLAPGHGELVTEPHDMVRRLIAHRLGREQKVVDALTAASPATLEELLPVVYADTPLSLHPVAQRSLLAHLLKLAEDSRATEQGGHWYSR